MFYDSELKVLSLIWEDEGITAKELSLKTLERYDWNKNTTYTVLKKLAEKDYIRREDPGYHCFSIVKKHEASRKETHSLINKLFEGSKELFLSSFIKQEKLSDKEKKELIKLLKED